LRLATSNDRPNSPGRLHPLVLNTGLNFMSQAILAGSMLITSTLASRALGQSDRGVLALLILTSIVVHVVLDLGLEQGLTIKIADGSIATPDRQSVLRGLAKHGSMGLGIAIVVTTFATLAGNSPLAALGGRNAPLTIAACSLAVVQRDLTGLLYGYQKLAYVSLVRMAGALLIAGGTAMLYWLGSASVTEYFAIHVAGGAAVTAALIVQVRALLPRRSHQRSGRSIDWRMVSRTGLPYYGASLSYSVVSRFDSFLLGATRPPAELGLYSNAVNLAEVVWYFPGALGQVLLPHTRGKSDAHLCRKTVVVVFVVSSISTLALGLSGQFLITVLFGPSFIASLTPLLLLLPGIVGMSCVRIGEIWLLIYGRARVVRTINTISATAGAVLWWVTIPRLGMHAAAMVSSILYCSMGLAFICMLLKTTRTKHVEI
jgi:O-antigen/teichoic acid export membrane protein